jgi:hypothetical protein
VYRILSLDISSKTGWAFRERAGEEGKFALTAYGLMQLPQPILTYPGGYPKSVQRAAWAAADMAIQKALELKPDVIVIEDTVPGRKALSQRFLEWAHQAVLSGIEADFKPSDMPKVIYLRTGTWREAVGLKQTKADAKNNRQANKLKELKKTNPELAKKMAKKLGVRGKVSKKHLSVRLVNELWNLGFKVKDNDIADAILLGEAYILGAEPNDGR